MTGLFRRRPAGSRSGRPALRRHLTEFGLSVLALTAIIPVAQQSLAPNRGRADAERARAVVSDDMLQSVNTANTCRRGRVALTFDSGPDIYTPQILRILRAYKVRATFYVLGEKAVRHPELIRAELQDHHVIGNQSWNHPHLADLDRSEVRKQLADTQQAIVAAGAPRPTLFRPPFGSTDAIVNTEVHDLGLRIIPWSVDSNDWRGLEASDITATVLTRIVPDSVVVMHDGSVHSDTTVRALPSIIDGLRRRGFCTALDTE